MRAEASRTYEMCGRAASFSDGQPNTDQSHLQSVAQVEALGADDGGELGTEDLDGDLALMAEVVGEVDGSRTLEFSRAYPDTPPDTAAT